jgi:GNAT superfamily N-acetyltransferase
MDPALRADDLAPGDRDVAARDWSDLRVHRVASAADPDFALGYARLWDEFGADGAMERRAVIAERLAWDPASPAGGARLAYEMLIFRRAGEIAAVRDHSAVVRVTRDGAPAPGPVVVHLSHALVAPAHRGSGLAAWLRALPLGAARRCITAARMDATTPVVLVAEMERGAGAAQRSYARAGFLKVDPAAARYAQPDFRDPTLPPLPFELVLRRVGREAERELPSGELAAIVDSIYAVYGAHVPDAALAPLRRDAADWTRRHATFRLVSPAAS